MEDNIFGYSSANPYHLSVGAVVRREDGKILCHCFGDIPQNPLRPASLFMLMRETVEVGESLERSLERGLTEEFGVTAPPQLFLGSLVSHFNGKGKSSMRIEKTTLYFLCQFEAQNGSLRKNDGEGKSELLWKNVEELIQLFQKQSHPARTDLDDSEILQRLAC